MADEEELEEKLKGIKKDIMSPEDIGERLKEEGKKQKSKKKE